MNTHKKHINIPIFVTHLGCPNICVFCNQKTITGRDAGAVTPEEADNIISEALKTAGDADAEVAFFGGSFTGIERGYMIRLLAVAKKYIDDGRVSAVRLSTRPDYISEEILDILADYGVSDIELGVQSMNDRVLLASKRGHTRADTVRSCAMIKAHNFRLVGQMMLGLPLSTPEDEVETAKELCLLGIDASRIYPTVVFGGTELADMTAKGEYTPLSVGDAVERAARVLDVLDRNGVMCIRCGLCATDALCSGANIIGGAFHPAIGEMTMGRLMLCRIRERIAAVTKGNACECKYINITVPRGKISQAIGYKGSNRADIMQTFAPAGIRFAESDELHGFEAEITLTLKE